MKTLFAFAGDYFAYCCIAGMLFGLAAGLRRRGNRGMSTLAIPKEPRDAFRSPSDYCRPRAVVLATKGSKMGEIHFRRRRQD